VWPTLPTYRVCYIANIRYHYDVGVVLREQNTFTLQNENNNNSTQMMKDLMTNKNIRQKKTLLWMV
jgi:hypothetical protein